MKKVLIIMLAALVAMPSFAEKKKEKEDKMQNFLGQLKANNDVIGDYVWVKIGLILLIVSVSGLFAGGLALFGWQWLGLTDFVSEAIDSVTAEFPNAMNVLATPWVGMLGIAVYALPLIGMLYGSILLLFRIKSPRWRPGLVIFMLWLIVLVVLGCTLFTGAVTADYFHVDTMFEL